MASRKMNGIKRSKVESIEKVLAEKRALLSRLSEEYMEVLKREVAEFDPRNEIKILNAQHRRLLAEINVTEGLEPERLPNDPDFLFESIKQIKEKEIEKLKTTLAYQDEAVEQLYQREKLQENSEQEDSSSEEDSCDSKILEKEQAKLDLMENLHRKLTRRLRKLARSHFTCSEDETSSNTTSESCFSEMNQQKSIYRILKVLYAELQNGTNFDLLEKSVIMIDDSYSREHLKLLVDCDIIEIISANPLLMSLKEP